MAESTRLEHVHGLRGLAAMVVVLQHGMQIVAEAGARLFDPLLQSINLGRFGVLLFFLISGLVVPFSFRGSKPLRNFLVSRFFRLYPLYWFSIPVLAGVAIAIGRPVTPGQLLANLTMVQGFLGQPDIGPGYWTLLLELIFYALCCALFVVRQLDRTPVIAAITVLLLALGAGPVVQAIAAGTTARPAMFPFFFAMFALGMLFRRGFVDGDRAAMRWLWVLVPGASLVGALMSGAAVPVGLTDARYFTPLALATASATPVLVFALVMARRPHVPGWAAWLGTVSYSIYLLQDVGLHAVGQLFPAGDWPLTGLALIFAITLAFAVLTYRLIEKPAIAWGRRFIAHAGERPGAGKIAVGGSLSRL